VASTSRVERARQRLAAQDSAGAHRECVMILADKRAAVSELAGAHLVLATCCRKSGDNASALSHAEQAVALVPDDPLARYAVAEVLEDRDKKAAIAQLQEAVGLNPRFVQAWNYLGILLGESGDEAAAATAFQRTIELDPQHARAWNNLGNAQRSLGRLADAAGSFAQALTLRPDYPLAAANLAAAQRDLGETAQAEATARAALDRMSGQPPYRPLQVILAGLLRERGAFDEAGELYLQAIKAAPDKSAGEWINLARIFGERGETERCREAFAKAYSLDSKDLRAALGAELTLPMIYADMRALEAARSLYAQGLGNLNRHVDHLIRGLSDAEVLDGFRATNFFLAYQGLDDRALQQEYAAFVGRAIDRGAPQWRKPLAPRRAHPRRIRIGFASAFLHVGTVGRYFVSWMTDLDRDRFELFVYHLSPGIDDVTAAVRGRADRFRSYEGSRARPSIVAPDVRSDELDVLVYPELGMDVTSFALSALRLAPLQYAAWGHPVTTGHATIDGYFSCEAMEPESAQAHYTEPLIRLPGIGTRYERPEVPADADRARFGLPDDAPLFLCPQSLFKIRPDNDALLARVLAENPSALLVLFAGRHPNITDQFMRRLSRACEARGLAIREHVRVLPPLTHPDFLRINRVCDVMLDTLHWSGGNTSLDALACGLPIVTLPGAFMRGRQSAGMLALLGIPELVANDVDDYARIVRRIVTDAAWRRELSLRIEAAHPRLFDVPDAVERVHMVIEEAVRTKTAR
jgi:predicted O-linked N-acetylglucosamine transferase (SPINDLY family)